MATARLTEELAPVLASETGALKVPHCRDRLKIQDILAPYFLWVSVLWAGGALGLKTPPKCTPFRDSSSVGPHIQQEVRGHKRKDREARSGMTGTWGLGIGSRRRSLAGLAGTQSPSCCLGA